MILQRGTVVLLKGSKHAMSDLPGRTGIVLKSLPLQGSKRVYEVLVGVERLKLSEESLKII